MRPREPCGRLSPARPNRFIENQFVNTILILILVIRLLRKNPSRRAKFMRRRLTRKSDCSMSSPVSIGSSWAPKVVAASFLLSVLVDVPFPRVPVTLLILIILLISHLIAVLRLVVVWRMISFTLMALFMTYYCLIFVEGAVVTLRSILLPFLKKFIGVGESVPVQRTVVCRKRTRLSVRRWDSGPGREGRVRVVVILILVPKQSCTCLPGPRVVTRPAGRLLFSVRLFLVVLLKLLFQMVSSVLFRFKAFKLDSVPVQRGVVTLPVSKNGGTQLQSPRRRRLCGRVTVRKLLMKIRVKLNSLIFVSILPMVMA